MQTIKNITAHADYSEALAKLNAYRAALADAQQLAYELDAERVAHSPKAHEPNAIEIADRLLSGVALQDNLGKRITETARKIETLRRAIEQQQREVIRIRGEHSRRVCRDALGEHVARTERIVRQSKNCAQRTRQNRNCAPLSRPRAIAARACRAWPFCRVAWTTSTPAMLIGGMPHLGRGMLPTTSKPRRYPLSFTKSKLLPVKLPPHRSACPGLRHG